MAFTTTGVIGEISEVPTAGLVVMLGAPAAKVGLTEEVVFIAVLLVARDVGVLSEDGVLSVAGVVGSFSALAVTILSADDTGGAAATVVGTVTVTVAELAPEEHALKVIAAPARAAPIWKNRVREGISIFLLKFGGVCFDT